MDRINLQINDFQLFYETIQNIARINTCVKIKIDKNGLTSHVSENDEIVRLDVESNCVCLPDDCTENIVALCTKNIQMLSQIFMKIIKAHVAKNKKNSELDFSDVEISVDDTTIYVKSSTLKTSLHLDNEASIRDIAKFKHELHPIVEIATSSAEIKDVLSSTFLFQQPEKVTVEVCHQDDMVRNIAYAVMVDPLDPRSNKMVTKFGNITTGDFTRRVLIDMKRLKCISLFTSDSIKVEFNKEPCFKCIIAQSTNQGEFFANFNIIGKYISANRAY